MTRLARAAFKEIWRDPMKLASLKADGRDGRLVIVSKDMKRARAVPDIAKTLQEALDRWDLVSAMLASAYDELNAASRRNDIDFDPALACAPLPRAYQWCDGSTF